ncbi:sodium-coupled neutral amino acid transporter 2 [Striga asiatica]|uniref:Sodium-coupled neutral amino acid transporter 2 n=1 Tax=Striga asiatica TaxID=4170 RepID=A0A5A7PZE6_STRAF|nr:sodium-coupled neutral amino acid transporter 2 [Striga asiatica]
MVDLASSAESILDATGQQNEAKQSIILDKPLGFSDPMNSVKGPASLPLKEKLKQRSRKRLLRVSWAGIGHKGKQKVHDRLLNGQTRGGLKQLLNSITQRAVRPKDLLALRIPPLLFWSFSARVRLILLMMYPGFGVECQFQPREEVNTRQHSNAFFRLGKKKPLMLLFDSFFCAFRYASERSVSMASDHCQSRFPDP